MPYRTAPKDKPAPVEPKEPTVGTVVMTNYGRGLIVSITKYGGVPEYEVRLSHGWREGHIVWGIEADDISIL